MKKNCVFTICSKNYLAQALTLKESFISTNPFFDFYLFLADESNREIDEIGIEKLDESWIPRWREMAFKYDVIEFNTSIKPFCFNKLFRRGYEKVIYLDPDIYVVKSLQPIFEWLDEYHIILSPHICYMELNYTGAQFDGSILNVGLYNLGFCAIKNSKVGQQVIEWWMKRLEQYCYGTSPLFVDQKWMMFIPLFFPNETLVTKHAGVNTAIWNLHERELVINNGEYEVVDVLKNKYPLLFFHFSGFDPDTPQVINRRHAKYNVTTFPSFIPIIEEYRQKIFDNGYYKYRQMDYQFVSFENGWQIEGFHRVLFKHFLELHPEYSGNPFSPTDTFYREAQKRKCIKKKISIGKAVNKNRIMKSDKIQSQYIIPLLKLLKKIGGINSVMKIRGLARRLSEDGVYNFLLD